MPVGLAEREVVGVSLERAQAKGLEEAFLVSWLVEHWQEHFAGPKEIQALPLADQEYLVGGCKDTP